MPDRSDRYVHDGLFFRSPEDLVAAAVPFLRDGLADDDQAVLVCTDEHNAAISEALGDVHLTYLPRVGIYTRASAAVAAYQQFMRERMDAGVRRVRLVGEVAFGNDARAWREWGRFEAICNEALAPYPLWSICAYDTANLPDPVITTGELTHPNIRRDGVRVSNAFYTKPAVFVSLMNDLERDPAPESEPVLVVSPVEDLSALRRSLTARLGLGGAGVEVVDKFVFACHELVTNAIRHGVPPVTVRLWVAPGRFVCTVTDRGKGFTSSATGYIAPHAMTADAGHLGLWLVRHLCDDLSATSTPEGFTVRVSTAYAPEAELAG